MADNNGLKLSFFDRIKLVIGLKSMAGQISAQTTPPSLWTKLDGTKSITGLLMIVAYYALPQFGIKVPDIFLKIGIAWAGVGFAHKLDKTTNIISAIAMALRSTNETINGDKK